MRVGIALAAYQPPIDFFAEQLKSIAEQTYQNWICVITLDAYTQADHPGATLESLRRAKDIEPYFNNPKFIWFQNPTRLGHKKNFEKAIQIALNQTGVQAIACSDQDDVWYPEKIARSVQALRAAGPLSLVHTDMHFLTRDGVRREESVWAIEHRGIRNCKFEHFLIRNIVAGCSMLFDAELARKFPIIPDGADYHDHWYAVVASLHGGVHAVHEPLYAYRQHGGNEVGVTPFPGMFTITERIREEGILTKCKKCWTRSHLLAKAASEQGLQFSLAQKLGFLWSWDFGAYFFALGMRNLFSDRPLARACLARALGKAAI